MHECALRIEAGGESVGLHVGGVSYEVGGCKQASLTPLPQTPRYQTSIYIIHVLQIINHVT